MSIETNFTKIKLNLKYLISSFLPYNKQLILYYLNKKMLDPQIFSADFIKVFNMLKSMKTTCRPEFENDYVNIQDGYSKLSLLKLVKETFKDSIPLQIVADAVIYFFNFYSLQTNNYYFYLSVTDALEYFDFLLDILKQLNKEKYVYFLHSGIFQYFSEEQNKQLLTLLKHIKYIHYRYADDNHGLFTYFSNVKYYEGLVFKRLDKLVIYENDTFLTDYFKRSPNKLIKLTNNYYNLDEKKPEWQRLLDNNKDSLERCESFSEEIFKMIELYAKEYDISFNYFNAESIKTSIDETNKVYISKNTFIPNMAIKIGDILNTNQESANLLFNKLTFIEELHFNIFDLSNDQIVNYIKSFDLTNIKRLSFKIKKYSRECFQKLTDYINEIGQYTKIQEFHLITVDLSPVNNNLSLNVNENNLIDLNGGNINVNFSINKFCSIKSEINFIPLNFVFKQLLQMNNDQTITLNSSSLYFLNLFLAKYFKFKNDDNIKNKCSKIVSFNIIEDNFDNKEVEILKASNFKLPTIKSIEKISLSNSYYNLIFDNLHIFSNYKRIKTFL